jgi:peroxiredoxin
MKRYISILLAAFITTNALAQEGLKPNDKAPVFTATDQYGKKINLEETLKKGPVVLVFYRGQWCPYCNQQLKKLEDSMALLAAKGATVLAISPETAANINKTVEKTKATFSILHDEGMAIMKSYDVAFAVDEKTVTKYKDYGIDFVKVNGEVNGANLPVPALFIIGKDGKIVFRHFDKNYTKRVSVAELLNHL